MIRTSPRKGASDAGIALCAQNSDCDGGVDRNATAAGGHGLCTTSGDCEEAVPVKSAQHMTGPIDYPDRPPAGGNHSPCWGSWGVQTPPLAVEHWVHNLEHGGVAFLYHCPSGCASEVSSLTSYVDGRRLALLTQYDDMKKRFAVVSWGYRLQSDTLDLPAFEAFYTAHVGQAPEANDTNPPSSCP